MSSPFNSLNLKIHRVSCRVESTTKAQQSIKTETITILVASAKLLLFVQKLTILTTTLLPSICKNPNKDEAAPAIRRLPGRQSGFSHSQEQVAQLLGVAQPRMSDLTRGKIQKFTIDCLIEMLAKLDKQVRLVIDDRLVA